MHYIERLQNAQALSVSVGKNYSEDQLMHILLDNFHHGGKFTAYIASHQAELRREENFTDQKYLSISSLQTDYLNLDSSSGSGRMMRHQILFRKIQFLWRYQSPKRFFKKIRKDKEKYCAAGDFDRQKTERPPRNVFKCVYVDNVFFKCLK